MSNEHAARVLCLNITLDALVHSMGQYEYMYETMSSDCECLE